MLVELGNLDAMLATSPMSVEEVWHNWIHSPSVRRYESGQCGDEEFAVAMIEELSLTLTPDEFMQHFLNWPKGLYEGADILLRQLAQRFELACLSNTNPAHANHFLSRYELLSHFDQRFLSHEMGLMKPDPEVFDHVAARLGVEPDAVLFFDDNETNVRAARQRGFRAEQAKTPDGVVKALDRLGLRD